jgi:hypothetical protein
MENQAITTKNGTAISKDIVANLIINGDLSQMTKDQKAEYIVKVCHSLGLNPLTEPLKILKLQGKQKLYATKDASEQLRQIHQVSITGLEKQFNNDLYIVTASASDKYGKQDRSTGAISVGGLKGDDLANALMKAETKAKRRVTLSICGLGMIDETEAQDIPGASTHKDQEPKKPTKKELADMTKMKLGIEELMRETVIIENKRRRIFLETETFDMVPILKKAMDSYDRMKKIHTHVFKTYAERKEEMLKEVEAIEAEEVQQSA